MNVLVLGSGGREHTIVWKLKQSDRVDNIYCIPGNGGISELVEVASINILDFQKIYHFVVSKDIGLVIVGPEQPLVEGVVDYLREKNVRVFGVTKKQAQLEGSKIFAKNFMLRNKIPTADFIVVDDYRKAFEEAKKFSLNFTKEIVIKADGLASGKGVFVCATEKDVVEALDILMKKKIFGSSGDRVVIEHKISGIEISLIGFCDGNTILLLLPSQDHKCVFDDDKGANTGGMGAYAPVNFISENLRKKIYKEIVERFLYGIKNEGLGYCGVIYFGLIVENCCTEKEQPYVLEFNCRFGDPETQVVLPLLENDLLEVVGSVIEQRLDNISLRLIDKNAVCVILSSGGYPGKYDVGKEIYGIEEIKNLDNIFIFHSGTEKKDGKYFTSGGRVLGITAIDNTLEDAINRCYYAVEKVYFENKHFRKDIARKGLKIENKKIS